MQTCDICGKHAKLERAVGGMFPWMVCDLCDLETWLHFDSTFHSEATCRFCGAAEVTEEEALGG